MAETVRVLVEEEEVDKRIRDLGEQISKDYEGKEGSIGFRSGLYGGKYR